MRTDPYRRSGLFHDCTGEPLPVQIDAALAEFEKKHHRPACLVILHKGAGEAGEHPGVQVERYGLDILVNKIWVGIP